MQAAHPTRGDLPQGLDDFVRSIRAMQDVDEVEARYTFMGRIQAQPGTWENITVFVVADYDDMRVNKVWPESGAWPPPERTGTPSRRPSCASAMVTRLASGVPKVSMPVRRLMVE